MPTQYDDDWTQTEEHAAGSGDRWDAGYATAAGLGGPQTVTPLNNPYATNAQIVENTFLNQTGRSGDAEGAAYWLNEMNNGMTVEQLNAAFNSSAEGQGFDAFTYVAPPVDNSLTGVSATGYTPANVTPTSYSASQVNLNDVEQYDAANADSEGYEAAQYQVGDNDLVSNQLTGLLDRDSAYMRQARADGMRVAAQRGLLNTSMAGEAAQAAAIRAGLPIAQADANTNWQTGLTNTNASNRSREFGAGASNTAELSNAGFDNAALSQYTNSFNNQQAVNQSAENQQLQFGANAANAAATTNANAANTASQFTASAENSVSVTNAANELNLVLSTMKNDTNIASLGLEALQIAFNNGVFNDETLEDFAGYLRAVQIVSGTVANSMVGQMADEASADIL
jgi:hypothetical protein